MTKLTVFNNQPKFSYDWELIEDSNDRAVATSAVKNYEKKYLELRSQADDIIKEDNLAKSKCVYQLKLTLPHGQFYDVCQKALNIGDRSASALASTGKLLMDGNYSDEVLDLVKVMEPQTSQRFLKMDEQSKSDYVIGFKDTGKVPTKRDFINFTKDDRLPPTRTLKAPQRPSIRHISSTGKRMSEAGISSHACLQWLIDLATDGTPGDKTKELVAELYNICYENN